MLSIKDLHVSVEDKAILRGLSLDVRPGEVHAIMGPNGSGKSTLSATLAGREDYEVTSGTVEFKGKDLLALSPEDRAGEGIFMAFQYPVEIPGVSNQFFLQTALNAVRSYRGQETLDRFEDAGRFINPFGKRWFFRRREKAQRYFANGGAGTGVMHS